MLQFMGSQRVENGSATEMNLSILWYCLSLGLERKLTFSSPLATAEFSKFADILLYINCTIIFFNGEEVGRYSYGTAQCYS